MDPVTLIVTALAAGAAAALQDGASAAVKDAYARLRALVAKRFADRPDGELVLARHEAAPQTWEAPLTAELSASGAGDDAGLAAAAQALMELRSTRRGHGRGSTRSGFTARRACRSVTTTRRPTRSARAPPDPGDGAMSGGSGSGERP